MKNNKILALCALAAGIGAVGYFGFGINANDTDMVGTIAPAKRYQAATVGEADVKLGDQSVAQFMQSDAFRIIQSDAKLAEAMRSDSFRQAMASDSFRSVMASDSFRQAMASDSFRVALASDSFRAAMASDAFRGLPYRGDWTLEMDGTGEECADAPTSLFLAISLGCAP